MAQADGNYCQIMGFLILSGLATGASWLAYFRALQLGEAAKVTPIDKLSVVLVAIFGVVFLKGIAAGPIIASGMMYVIITTFQAFQH